MEIQFGQEAYPKLDEFDKCSAMRFARRDAAEENQGKVVRSEAQAHAGENRKPCCPIGM